MSLALLNINQNLSHQQAQHNDLTSLQTLLQFDFLLHPQSHQETKSLKMFHNQSVDHLANSWKLKIEFQVDIYEALSKLQQYKKFVLLQFGFPQYLNSNEQNI
jgi:gamma-glutamyl-gamma-aminobutyrate hydrolase PuuD